MTSKLSEIGQDAYLDMTPLRGQTIDLRWRFVTYDIDEEELINFDERDGWYIDDLELLDIKFYEVEASISADNAETVTDGLKEIVIESDGTIVNTKDLEIPGVSLSLNPNPTKDQVTVQVSSDRVMQAQLTMLSIEGQELSRQQVSLYENQNYINLNLESLPGGIYLIQLRNDDKVITKKLVVE